MQSSVTVQPDNMVRIAAWSDHDGTTVSLVVPIARVMADDDIARRVFGHRLWDLISTDKDWVGLQYEWTAKLERF